MIRTKFLIIGLFTLVLITFSGCNTGEPRSQRTQRTQEAQKQQLFTETSVSSQGVQSLSTVSSTKTTGGSANIPIYGYIGIDLCRPENLRSLIEKKLKEKGLPPISDYSQFTMFGDLVEKDKDYADIKALTNTKYSVYSINKNLGKYYGKLQMDYRHQHIDLDDSTLNSEDNVTVYYGFFINGDYNHMPRAVEIFVNESSMFNGITKIYKTFDQNKLIEPVKNLIGVRKAVIEQYFECDLDGDNKIEKIVQYRNYGSDGESMTKGERFKTKNDKRYYNIIAVLDENYKVIHYITKVPAFSLMDVNPNFEALENADDMNYTGVNSIKWWKDVVLKDDFNNISDYNAKVKFFVDVDNDNIMEVITEHTGYRCIPVGFTKVKEGKGTSWMTLYDGV